MISQQKLIMIKQWN